MNRKITLLALLFAMNAGAQTLTFLNKIDKPIARAGACSSKDASDDNVFIVNGFNTSGQNTSEVEKYNIFNDTWSQVTITPPTIGKRYGNMEMLGNWMYIFNGQTNNGNNDKVEIINTDTQQLVVSSALNPNPVYAAGSSIWGDRVITFGGCYSKFNAEYSNKTYFVNPYTTWDQLANMPVAMEAKGEVIYGNGNNSKLYVFGGYSESNAGTETFESVTAGADIALTDWVNVAEAGTAVFKGANFSNNKYAQITAFNGSNQEPSNIAWLISKPMTAPGTDPVFLSFYTKDGYNNGATLQAFLITNWTGNIATSTKTLLNANMASGSTSGYATNFTDSGDIRLNGDLTEFRIGFKYVGGYTPLATTTYQVDNVRVFKTMVSKNIYIYDFATNAWTTSPTVLPQSLSAYGITRNDENDNKIYITGDYSNQTFAGVFNVVDQTFTTLTTSGMIGRRHHNAEYWNGSLYIFGGNTTTSASTALTSVQVASLANLDSKSFTDSNLRLYPNPVRNILHFNLDQTVSKVSVFNLLGQEVMAKTMLSNEGKIDVSELHSGTYLVKMTVGNEIKTAKIIKE